MSYYPPNQGYGYPGYPPQPTYAAGAPVPGYPPAGAPGYPPPGAPPAGYGYPPGAPPPAQGYGYPAPAPAPGGYGYPAPGGPPPGPVPGQLQHAPTMASLHHAPTMAPQPSAVPQGVPNYFSGAASGFSPQKDAETIHQACRGLGTNEKAIINVVANRTPEHLAMVTSVYKQFYGKDLVEVLKKETSGNFGKTLHYLILPPLMLDVELIRNAVVGAGTNERCLIHVLMGRSNADMAALKNTYYMTYHKSLEQDVKEDVSGYLEKLFVVSIQGTRDEIGHYQYNVDADVHSLYKAGEGRIGTDESHFIHVLCNRPDAHLRSVFVEYQRRYNKKFTKVIKSEFSGWIKIALCYLVNWIQNPAHCVAKHLEKSMKGMGTDDQALIRLLVRNRTPTFMTAVKTAYLAKYRKTLRERIRGETSGDYRRLLCAIIGEPEQ